MMYVFDGKYREFRGYVFANGKPTTITDKGTLEAIKREPSFREYHEEKIKETPEEVLDQDACPKCGKIVRQGKYMHQKYCAGLK